MTISQTLLRSLRPVVERFPQVAKAYRVYQESRQTDEDPTMSPLGFKIAGSIAAQQGVFEPTETSIVSRLLDDIDTFVNVGANVGYYCCIALNKNKPVIAFEPIASNVQLLLKNVRANGWSAPFELLPIALSVGTRSSAPASPRADLPARSGR